MRLPPRALSPPSKHQLAFMIWLAVFPTLTVINLLFGSWLGTLTPVVRTFVLATVAVPIVIYGLMPHLHRLRRRLILRHAKERHSRACSQPFEAWARTWG